MYIGITGGKTNVMSFKNFSSYFLFFRFDIRSFFKDDYAWNTDLMIYYFYKSIVT